MTGLSALHSLTARGRGLVAVGLVAGVLGVLAGQPDLIRLGALLLALPCLALVVLARGRVRLSCTRELSRSSVPEGREVEVRLRVANVSRLTTGLLLLSDRLPPALGDSPRFLLAPVQPGRAGEARYVVRGGLRGRYDVGPLSVRLADPFGLCELVRVFPGTLPLVVTPAVEALPAVRLGGDRAAAGEGGSRSVATAGGEDFSTREWRQGDDLRKVHWRSTARTGELMVRQEEQLSRARALLVLDARSRSHTGSGSASSVETAVRAAASVGVHLLRAGSGLRLLTVGAAGPPATDLRARGAGAAVRATTGRGTPGRRSPRAAARQSLPGAVPVDLEGDGAVELLLEQLAVLSAGREAPPLGAALGPFATGSPQESLVVAVLGRLDAADADALARLRTGNRSCVAVVSVPGVPVPVAPAPVAAARLGTAAVGAAAPRTTGVGATAVGVSPAGRERSAAEPVDLLRAAGWRVVVLPPGGALSAVWAQLDPGADAAPGAGGARGPGGARGAGGARTASAGPGVPGQSGASLSSPVEPERTSR